MSDIILTGPGRSSGSKGKGLHRSRADKFADMLLSDDIVTVEEVARELEGRAIPTYITKTRRNSYAYRIQALRERLMVILPIKENEHFNSPITGWFLLLNLSTNDVPNAEEMYEQYRDDMLKKGEMTIDRMLECDKIVGYIPGKVKV